MDTSKWTAHWHAGFCKDEYLWLFNVEVEFQILEIVLATTDLRC